MDSTKRAIKYQYSESKVNIFKFWIVMIIADLFVIVVNKYTDTKMGINIPGIMVIDGFSMIMNLLPIIIYFIAYSYEIYYKHFPLALTFSTTRRDFFKSIVLSNIVTAMIFAIIQAILIKIDPIIIKIAGLNLRYDLTLLNGRIDNLIYLIIVLFIGFILFSTIWNLIALLNYKFGYKLWIALGVVALLGNPLISLIPIDPGSWLNLRIDTLLFIKLIIITILIYIPIYYVTINTDINNNL